MKFTLAIYSSPLDGDSAECAYSFARESLNQGHRIYRLFFFNRGVLNAVDDQSEVCRKWCSLIREHDIDAIVCSASAQKHKVGIADKSEQALTGLKLNAVFTLGGIAQLIDATVYSDRLMTFGG